MSIEFLFAYLMPMVTIWAIYLGTRRTFERRSAAKLAAATDEGMLDPASLHPAIDPLRCIGCGSCIRACPEGRILGLIEGKAALVEPSRCIGHGACKAACPTDAITLVFGTERRGVDIPNVDENFQTNVPGIFIAGELGGMGLVRNAIEQGRQAMESIRALQTRGRADGLDVVIIGCGPAGLSASLAAMQHNLRSVTVEQDSLGGTVAHFPRGKLVMTAPFNLPLVGKAKFTELSKEELIRYFEHVVRRTGLRVRFGERVDAVVRTEAGFEVHTTRTRYRTRAVLLAIGRRGTPRTLDVPGEEQSKVMYRLVDPQQYRGRHVLVVGGGDSALEAACSIADEPGTVVTLTYRGASFSRARLQNRKRVQDAARDGRLAVVMSASVKRIGRTDVEYEQGGEGFTIENHAVVVCAGGILPTSLLERIGVTFETKFGTV